MGFEAVIGFIELLLVTIIKDYALTLLHASESLLDTIDLSLLQSSLTVAW
jgi:hypothetical protein